MTSHCSKTCVALLIILTVIIAVYVTNWLSNGYHSLTKGRPHPFVESLNDNADFADELSFLPTHIVNCEELFENRTMTQENSATSFNSFLIEMAALDEQLKRVTKGKNIEGHVGTYMEQLLATARIVKLPFVRTVCETGFNAGHSALLYLLSNPVVHIYSFDIGRHRYSRSMSEYIMNKYPGRLNVTWGNSMITIKDFRFRFPLVTCDLICIDGGHTEQVANSDFVEFKNMAAPRNLVLFDDYPANDRAYSPQIGTVWEAKKRSGELSELFECAYSRVPTHGFSLGRINFL